MITREDAPQTLHLCRKLLMLFEQFVVFRPEVRRIVSVLKPSVEHGGHPLHLGLR